MANTKRDISGFTQLTPLQRMWPTASRKQPDPPLPRAEGIVLTDAQRGAVSPLDGRAVWPDDPRRRKR
jgi:hypothetical protein